MGKVTCFLFATLALTACAGPRSEAVGETTTTSAYVPLDRRTCPADLAPRVDFQAGVPALTSDELALLDRWARCLRQPEMQHTTVVLVEPGVDPAALTNERATAVEEALVTRGVARSRIVRAGREAAGAHDVLRLEVTTAATLRGLRDPQIREGIR